VYTKLFLLIHKVKRTELGGKKIFEIGGKYYFEDIGLRNSILGYKPADINKVLENLVFSHLKISGYNVMIGVMNSLEVDFAAEKKGEILYVKVAYLLHDQATVDREFGNLLAIDDQYPKMVVSMDEDYATGTYKGVRHYHIREFLTKQL
jgi:predicted AAA+ superfamily ATPase